MTTDEVNELKDAKTLEEIEKQKAAQAAELKEKFEGETVPEPEELAEGAGSPLARALAAQQPDGEPDATDALIAEMDGNCCKLYLWLEEVRDTEHDYDEYAVVMGVLTAHYIREKRAGRA